MIFAAFAVGAVGWAAFGRGLHPLEEIAAESERLLQETDPAEFRAKRWAAIRRLELYEPLRGGVPGSIRARLEVLGLDPEAALRYSSHGEERSWAKALLWATGAGAKEVWAEGDRLARFIRAAEALHQGESAQAAEIAVEQLRDTPGLSPARWIAVAAGAEGIAALEEWAPDSPLVRDLAAKLRAAEDLQWRLAEDPASAARVLEEHFAAGGFRTPAMVTRLAEALERQGRLDEAYNLYREAVNRVPRHVEAVRGIGRIDYARGRYKHASVALGAAIAFDPEDGESCLLLARTLLLDTPPQPERAVRFFEEAILRGFDGARVRLELGRVLFALRQWERAEECFRRSVSMDETVEALTALGNSMIRKGAFDDARRALERALALDGDAHEAAFLQAMLNYYTSDDPAAAAREIERAVEAGFRTTSSLLMRARCRADAGDLERALSDLGEALKLDPESGEAFALRANVFLKARRPEEALRDAEMAIRCGNETVDIYVARAGAAMLLSDPEMALESLARAVALAPDRHDLHAKRFLILMERGDLEGGLEAIDRALELAPRNVSYRLHRGWVLLHRGRSKEALSDFERVRQWQPGNLSAIEWSGRARLELGQVDEGLVEIRHVLQAHGASRTDLWLVVALAELSRFRWDEALDAAERAERGVREGPEALLVAGRALVALGRGEAAMSKFDEALAADQEYAEAWFRRGEAKVALGMTGAGEDFERALRLRPDWKRRVEEVLRKR